MPGVNHAQQEAVSDMSNRTKVIIPIAIAVGCLPWLVLFVIAVIALIGAMAGMSGGPISGDQVALVHITGVISSGTGGDGLFSGGGAGAERVVKQLERARKDDDVKAIVLRINSPGGSAAGSQEVYEEIVRIRKGGKIVVASMGDVAASGGYYVASAANKIYANGSTITGSIGVITETSDMSQLFKKIGIDFEVIKSGKHKDMGSGLRKLTPEERQIFQAMIDDVFKQFITAVSQGRRMPESDVRKIADGRIFTGRQAKKIGLVDAIGGLRDATLGAAREAGIAGEPKVVEYDKTFFDTFFGSAETRSVRMTREEEMILRRLLQSSPTSP